MKIDGIIWFRDVVDKLALKHHVKTIISIKFPYPISNCHEHVWRRR
jgi:hypothetical protein